MFVRKVLRLLGVVVTVAWASVAAQGWVLEPDRNGDLYGLKDLLPNADELDKRCRVHPNEPYEASPSTESHQAAEPIEDSLSDESEQAVELCKGSLSEESLQAAELSKQEGPSETLPRNAVKFSEKTQEEPNLFKKIQLLFQPKAKQVRKDSEIDLAASKVIPAMSSCGNDRRLVALSFDDGPDALYNDEIMEELDRLGVRATFFLSPLARGYDQDTLCKQSRALVNAGHELQLHTMTHPHLPALNQQEFDYQVQGGIDWMENCGLPRPNMFRPPYGELKPNQARYLHEKYRLIIAQWNIESSDFDDDLTQDDVFRNVREGFETNVGIGNSAVILMHDLYAGKRSGIISRVVEYFHQHGYTFVTMNQCFNACKGPICKGNGGPSPYKDVYVP